MLESCSLPICPSACIISRQLRGGVYIRPLTHSRIIHSAVTSLIIDNHHSSHSFVFISFIISPLYVVPHVMFKSLSSNPYSIRSNSFIILLIPTVLDKSKGSKSDRKQSIYSKINKNSQKSIKIH